MASISKCQYDIQKYNYLKENIRSMLPSLKSAMGSIDDTNNSIKGKYLIDDEDTPLLRKTTKVKNDINKTCTMLENTILPAIDRAINDLNKQIARLEAERAARYSRYY